MSEGAVYEAERHRQALGDITPITRDDLWARVAEDMSRKPYKALGSDLMAAARQDREAAIDTFIACHHAMEKAHLDDPDVGPKTVQRLRAQAINDSLGRHLVALDHALRENAALLHDWVTEREAVAHLRSLQVEAVKAKHNMPPDGPRPFGPRSGVSV